MEYVEPIRDKQSINDMKSFLRNGYGTKAPSLRNWLLFTLGINSALRISDLLRLTVEDVASQDRTRIHEQKTSKLKDVAWSAVCTSAVKEYLAATGLTEGPLFPSRKGDSPISRQQAWDIINDVAREAKVITKNNGVHIGSHSMRKSFAYHQYASGTSIEKLQKILNHSSSSVTLRYIGIQQTELDEVYLSSCL